MNDKLPELQKGQQGPNAQDPSRRRLLRAAASAAPLIATLPSGAAAQVASTYQCVAKNADDNATAADLGSGQAPTDQWIRITAIKRKWIKGRANAFAVEFTDYPGYWYRENDGSYFDFANDGWSKDPNTADVTVAALRMYSQAALAVGNSSLCAPSGNVGSTTPPFGGCVYPIAKRSVSSDNMGLTVSCFGSFSPPPP